MVTMSLMESFQTKSKILNISVIFFEKHVYHRNCGLQLQRMKFKHLRHFSKLIQSYHYNEFNQISKFSISKSSKLFLVLRSRPFDLLVRVVVVDWWEFHLQIIDSHTLNSLRLNFYTGSPGR